MVKNPSARWETWLRSLGWEDSLEEGNPLQYSCLENPHEQRNFELQPWLCKELDMTEQLTHIHTYSVERLSQSVQIAIPKHHKLDGLNNKYLHHTILEAKTSKIKVPADSVSSENSLLGSYTAVSFLCPHMTEGARELFGASFIRALLPFMRTLPSGTQHLPKGPTSQYHHSEGDEFQHMDFGRTQIFSL